MKYQYVGSTQVHIAGYGLVEPNEVISVDFEINNPDFVPVKEVKKGKDK